MAVELDRLLLRDHLFDPDDSRILAACFFDLLSQLGGNLGRIRSAGAQDDLCFLRQIRNCVYEMSDALLSCDAADEQDIGYGRIDPIIC